MERKLIQIFVLLNSLFMVVSSVEPWAFHRYYRPASGDNLYTTNWKEIGTTKMNEAGKYGYIYYGSTCDLYPSRVAGTIPLYRMMKLPSVIHMYTTSEPERRTMIASREWKAEGVAGYCYPTVRKDTVALYRYRKGNAYFYTTKSDLGHFTAGEKSRHGFISEGIACFVPVKHAQKNWRTEWKKDLNKLMGQWPSKYEAKLATSIYTYLSNKYNWRDWLVVVYPDMYGGDNHWRHACKNTYTVDYIHWRKNYNVMVSSVRKGKPFVKFTGDAKPELDEFSPGSIFSEPTTAQKIYENLPEDVKSCKYPLVGAVHMGTSNEWVKEGSTFEVRARPERLFHQVFKAGKVSLDWLNWLTRPTYLVEWHVFILG